MKLDNGVTEQIETLLKSAGAQVERAMYIAMEQDDATVMYCTQEIARYIEVLQKAILRRCDHMSITEEFELYGDDDDVCDCDNCPYEDECESEEDECSEFCSEDHPEVEPTIAVLRAVFEGKSKPKDVKVSGNSELLKALYETINNFYEDTGKSKKSSTEDKK